MSRRPTSRPTEIFLSHASPNRRMATRLAEFLRGQGIRVWYSRTNIVGAQAWHDEIGDALARCDWFAIILSPDAVKSEWVKRELLFALRERRYRNRIVPILYRRCDVAKLSWTLGDFQNVDFTATFEDGCRDLLRIWGIGYGG